MADSVFEAVYINAKKQPDKLCIADETTAVNYREYISLSLKLASLLLSFGVKRGDRVVVEASQSVKYLALQLGLEAIGAVFVPLERGCAQTKIKNIAEVAEAKLAVVSSSAAEGFLNLDELFERALKEKEYDFQSFPEKDAVCELLFSTGTTGKEKGIIIANKNNIALAENVMFGTEMKEDNVELIPSPLNHSHALRSYYANMLCGGSVVLLGGILNLFGFFGAIERYAVNSIDLVPSALSILLKLSKNKLSEYKDTLRYIEFGSAPIMQADKEKIKELLPKTRLYNFYGSTESGRIAVYDFNRPEDKNGCIGRPTKNAKIFAVDGERNAIETEKGKTGLLAASGKMNMLGYWHDESETQAALCDGVVYTNDEIYFDSDGDIILLGRKGDVINVGGNKVSPDEVESIAKKIEGIADCACVPAFDELKGSVPKLFVVMKPGADFDSAQIRAKIAAETEPYKVPKQIVEIAEIPRTYNGKIIRRKLMQ